MTIAPNTTKLGIEVFDQAFGGIYLRKPTILCGRRKSGKFVVATQLMVKTLLIGDRIVLFTAKNPEEVLRMAPDDIIDLEEAVENGQLIICPYSAMQRSGTGPYAPLPFPQALDDLSALVKDNGITYAIFDSIVPWTAIQPLEAMQEHVDTFFSTLDGLGLTSLLLLPEPASAASLSLATVLREVCPINLEISAKNFGAEFTMQVTKYQGLHGAAKKLPQKFALDLTPGVGFNSPDAPRAKTISDLEAFASANRAAAAEKGNAHPAFRPFLAGGLANFENAGGTSQAELKSKSQKPENEFLKPKAESQMPKAEGPKPKAGKPSFAPFLAQPPGLATFDLAGAAADSAGPAPATAPAPTPQAPAPGMKNPESSPASGAEDGFSFASVIDLPEFHNAPPTPARPPVNPPAPEVSGIQFSSVIR